jgi:hypothetical protein
MPIEDTRVTAEIKSSGELNRYLQEGWVLILPYVKHRSDTQEPRFVIAWQENGPPIFPEFLDEWEMRDMYKNSQR